MVGLTNGMISNFAESIFTDAVNVMPNVHNYMKIFATKLFLVRNGSSKNVKKFAAIRYTCRQTGHVELVRRLASLAINNII